MASLADNPEIVVLDTELRLLPITLWEYVTPPNIMRVYGLRTIQPIILIGNTMELI